MVVLAVDVGKMLADFLECGEVYKTTVYVSPPTRKYKSPYHQLVIRRAVPFPEGAP